MNLRLTSRYQGDVLVAHCAGRIVAGAEAQQLHDLVKNALPETPEVVVHLGGVVFMDSTGMGTLARLLASARQHGGDLKLCAVPEMLRKVLTLTNLHTIFETYATEAEAVAASYRHRPLDQSRLAAHEILCVEESPDVLAYLAGILRGAGYRVLTGQNSYDAQILLKARRPALILLGPRVSCKAGADAPSLLRQLAPEVPLLKLDTDFSHLDAGEAAAQLLEKLRAQLPAG